MAATQMLFTVKITPKGSEVASTVSLVDFLTGEFDRINGIVTIGDIQYTLSTVQYWGEDVLQ